MKTKELYFCGNKLNRLEIIVTNLVTSAFAIGMLSALVYAACKL